ncbi:hypothetical protein G9A89_012438 [Geosiphon pyriformis]|nr:hypothetical protein G9A89_012438 [Geosiphon pyriformis]
MAGYARKAYCRRADIGYIKEKQFNGNKVQLQAPGLTRNPDNPNNIIVYIKGAQLRNSLHYYRRNFCLYTLYSEQDSGLVNQIWYRNFKKKENSLLNMIKNFIKDKDSYSIDFTGHGLGGVHVMFLALAYRKLYPKVQIRVVTFGTPRPGDQDFANYFSTQIPKLFRVTNYDDFAPHLPPASVRKYRHPHTEYWISQYRKCDNCDEDLPPLVKCLKRPRKAWNLRFDYVEENPDCNAGKYNLYDKRPKWVHIGPYFGVTMNCDYYVDPSWLTRKHYNQRQISEAFN